MSTARGTELSLLGVSKNYGGAQALVGVDLRLEPGTVHALVGENGAGKSTALKIFAGLEQPSAGRIELAGEPVVFGNRTAAIRAGVGLVPQQLSLIGEMSLVENLILTRPTQLAHRRAAASALRAVADEAGLTLNLSAPVRTLGLAERQLGELAIALAQGARVLLLDEPTSAIGPHESGLLFEKVTALASTGVTVLLITHRLDEVRSVADHVTVLSHGRVTLDAEVADVTDDDLVFAMVGEIPAPETHTLYEGGDDRLVLDGVTAQGSGVVPLRDVSLTVRAGEIVGILGVAGNGQGTLADTAVGIIEPLAGSVSVGGAEIGGRPEVAREHGVSYVPEVRAEFLLSDSPVTRSAVLRRLSDPAFRRRGALQWGAITEFTKGLMERHDVRPRNPAINAGALSGGNQQKLLVGRELDGAPAVAVLHGPTQGLDLHAAAAIRSDIRRAANAGTAVLLVSADVDEVRELADRILVLSKGRIVDEFTAAEFDLQRLGRAMAGLVDHTADAPAGGAR
ncbi:ABC transporter ATP-binding protein [Galbitalea soli]|uniref:ATP-binding cassette domain-containing protein n=1 Tax=Galbitalea soli TaxID=1268042 RepID=A0A7C9TR69_9MICO|nr:ATP-binding cassette domain-containing protein [Galbitalea soli]NEM91499.1 ATP-binding cassette domain-containing protein [Galbitalea soli]NYJ30192.1 simple sugar transport system ATP-binding protein [Galbitalea soli]